MSFNRITILGVLFIHLALKDHFSESVLFKFTNAACESYNKTIIVINLCRLRAINRQKTTFNFNTTLLQPVNKATAYVQCFKRANGYKPWAISPFTINVCQFLNKPYNPIALLIYKQFRDFTNFQNQTCPLIGIKTILGFYPRPEIFKLPLPTGEYLVSLTWYFNKKLAAVTNASVEFVEDWSNTQGEKSLWRH